MNASSIDRIVIVVLFVPVLIILVLTEDFIDWSRWLR